MSRSKPEEGSSNPTRRWFQWEGGANAGYFSYWDKEKEERIPVTAPFVFAVLDILGTVTGYSEHHAKRLFSNEVHLQDLGRKALQVRFHGGAEIAHGFWRDIKDHVTSREIDGSFANSIYIATKMDGELQIANIRLRGAGLGAWMDFEKEQKSREALYNGAVVWNGETIEGTKGSVTFQKPVFQMHTISDETANEAMKLDETLQQYLTGYLNGEPDKPDEIDRSGTTQLPGPIESDLDESQIPF